MTTIDDLERKILAEARGFIEPNAADEARVFSRLAADLGLAGVATVAPVADQARGVVNHGHSTATRLRHVMGTRKAVALSFALLGTGAGFGAGFLAGRHSSHAELASPTTVVENRSATDDALPATAPTQLVASVQRNVEAPVERRAASPQSTTHRRASPSVAEHGAPELAVTDPIDEEVALLKRAERAIRSNNALLALALLRELDQRFPRGRLLEERSAARVMANCQQLGPETAHRAGEAYLRSSASNVYHERVRQLCGVSEVAPNQKSDASKKASGSSGD